MYGVKQFIDRAVGGESFRLFYHFLDDSANALVPEMSVFVTRTFSLGVLGHREGKQASRQCDSWFYSTWLLIFDGCYSTGDLYRALRWTPGKPPCTCKRHRHSPLKKALLSLPHILLFSKYVYLLIHMLCICSDFWSSRFKECLYIF